MSLIYTSHFLRSLKKRIKQKPQLKQKISRQVNLLTVSPKHPVLRSHCLKGKRISQCAISLEANLRITFFKKDGNIVLTDIITHDEY